MFALRADGRRNWRRFWSRSAGSANLADLEAHEPPDGNVLAKLRDRLRNHLADRDALVLDVVLLVQAVLFVELLHLSRRNLVDYVFRLAGGQSLRSVNLTFRREHLWSDILPPHVSRIERRDVHCDVMAKLLESFRARHEVGLAIDFHEHADLPARVDIAPHDPFACFPLRFLCCCRLSLFSQNLDGLINVSA